MMKASTKGICLAAVAGLSWGSMAVAGQYLLTGFNFCVEDLVCARLLGAGLIMLIITALTTHDVFRGLTAIKNWLLILGYATGIYITQYAFFEGIRLTNAGTAAMIVAVGPAIVLLYLHFFEGRALTVCEVGCVAVAFIGVVLLGTKGDFDNLMFSAWGLFWCFLSVLGGSFSTLLSRTMIKAVGVTNGVGWSMTVAGAVATLYYVPTPSVPLWTLSSIFAYGYIVIVGTVLAFWCFLQSLKYVAASVASLVACLEPLSGFVLSLLLLSVSFCAMEFVGAAMILGAIVWLSWPKKGFDFS